jgi:hypothetical protein
MSNPREFLAVIKRPGEDATIELLPADEHGSLKALQAAVGGFIEAVELPELGDHITSYANEEGFLLALEPNLARLPGYSLIVGPVVVLGINRRTGESKGLTAKEAEQAAAYLNSHAVTLRDLVRLGFVRVVEL